MDDSNTVFDEAELVKAEEFKDKGNEYFKGKLLMNRISSCRKLI
jgi:hypothetical protein